MNQFFIDLNIENLGEGLKSTGEGLGFYKPFTMKLSEENGRPKTQLEINLKDTGDFWNRFYTDVIDNMLIFDSSDEKTNMLMNRYGKDIFGLPEKYKPEVSKRFSEILLPKIKTVLRNG